MPIQLLGSRRSGSGLYRVILDQLPTLHSPPSTHELEFFKPLEPYMDLNNDTGFRQLIDDMIRCVQLNPAGGWDLEFDAQAIFDNCNGRSVIAVFEAIYDAAAINSGAAKGMWVSKCPTYGVNYFDEFERHFGNNMKYIHMFRDGRDVALSFTKAITGDQTYYHIAREWADTQRKALEIKHKIADDRFLSVSYEELLEDPQKVCRQSAEFVGVAYDPAMLEFYNNKSAIQAAKSSDQWGNLDKKLIKNNSNKWLKESSYEEIHIFESIAGDVLEELGYTRHTNSDLSFSQSDIDEFERINNEHKKMIIDKADPSDVARRNAQRAVADAAKSRLGCDHVEYHGSSRQKHQSQKETSVA